MVFLHGGGYQTGSGAQPVTDGSVLAATTNSIIVTVNYRLGLLGMLAHPAFLEETGTFGNYNIMDQIQALRWVQENIGFVLIRKCGPKIVRGHPEFFLTCNWGTPQVLRW
jgi:carboxylesterase type B